jgi:hypothetical protein
MAADTETTIVIIDGGGDQQHALVGQNVSGAIAPETLLRADGQMVGAAYGLPTQRAALSGVQTNAAATSLVLKASAGALFSLQVSSTASGWFLLLDAAALPSNGTVSPRRAWSYTGPGSLDFRFDPPLQMQTGAVVAFSSTGPFSLTIGAADAFISGEIV